MTNFKIWVQLISPSAWELKTISLNFDKINIHEKKEMLGHYSVYKCDSHEVSNQVRPQS